MAFLTSYRAEKIYFEKLRSNIDIAKSYIQRGATDEVMALLQNAVDADGAIMLCYRNIGEVWADLASQLEKTQKALEDLKTALEEYHDDLNKKIDEINNYLVRLINALDERVTILENESKVKFAYLLYDSVEDVYSIQYNGETADFDALSAALEYPHLLVLIDSDNGNIYYPRSVSDVLIDFHADGVSGSDYVDISVTMTDSDVVTVTEKTIINYTFGTGFNVSSANEVTPDLTVLQAKLSAGFGIEIDSNNEISVDTADVQEKLIAGQNITLTPDSTDPTKTVIDASEGSSYSAGYGIEINNNSIALSKIIPNNSRTQDTLMSEVTYTVEHDEGSTIPAYNCRNQGVNLYTANQPISAWIAALNNHRNLYIRHRIIPINQETISGTNKNIELFYQIAINFEPRNSANPAYYLLREVGYRAMSDTPWNAGNQRRELDIQAGNLYLFDFLKLLESIEDKTLQYNLRIITTGIFKIDGKIPAYNDSELNLLDNIKNFGVTSFLY